ncbi:NAD-dependent epimerase/dehydratase family protein [Amphibacillus sediminis]|uniref:NAD-dependent epimerase/dehydratase family protein n=1 Tax=Amphibacillus sediminis TaxID=360185 RepID=UPI00082E7D12|nr:NAD-dependent epimerase/dehydratase family protein [Amphibacillus sediminis]
MKRILITGKNSYIGNSFERWVTERYPEAFQIDKVSLRTDKWKSLDFSIYDVILHVAGIAHVKETKKNKALYYKVNRDLTKEVASKAKKEGTGQFIYLSSMSVFGLVEGEVNANTIENPVNAYGKSKLQSEKMLLQLKSNNFFVAIIRPPMIYGPNCVGNYSKLSKLVKKSFLFPDIKNERSMIFVDNLSEFIIGLIDDKKEGIFHPQNINYVNTSKMAELISDIHNRKLIKIKCVNFLINSIKINLVRKVFGDLKYSKKMSPEMQKYNVVSFEESIRIAEQMEK